MELGGVETPAFVFMDRIDRVVHDRQHLETEGQHFGMQPRLHDLLRVDIVVDAVRQTAIEHDAYGAHGLYERTHDGVVKRDGQG